MRGNAFDRGRVCSSCSWAPSPLPQAVVVFGPRRVPQAQLRACAGVRGGTQTSVRAYHVVEPLSPLRTNVIT